MTVVRDASGVTSGAGPADGQDGEDVVMEAEAGDDVATAPIIPK